MKISTISQIILAISIAILYVLHFTSSVRTEVSNKQITKPVNNTSIQVAYVAIDSLYIYYNYYKKLLNEFQAKQQKAQNQLQDRIKKLEEESLSYQRRAQAGLMSQNDIQKAEQDLSRKQLELQTYQQTVSNGLLEEEKVMGQKVLESITSFLEEYNKDKNFDIILNYTPGNALWYIGESFDITEEVIDGLNAVYIEK